MEQFSKAHFRYQNLRHVGMLYYIINRLRIGHTRLTHTLIYCHGMINQYALLISPRSLLSTFSLYVLILLLSVAGILVLLR